MLIKQSGFFAVYLLRRSCLKICEQLPSLIATGLAGKLFEGGAVASKAAEVIDSKLAEPAKTVARETPVETGAATGDLSIQDIF